MPKILIIVPAYNEEEAIKQTIETLLSEQGYDILVVNDGSVDNTENILKSMLDDRLSYVSLPQNCGIGAGMQTGFQYAVKYNYDYGVQFDGDGQHSIESLKNLIEHTQENDLQLCVGSRFLEKEEGNFQSTALRRFGIRFFSSLISILAKTRVTDPTSGFRVYGKKALVSFAVHYPDDYPEPEALFYCARRGFKIGEIPVKMHERQGGESSIKSLSSVYYMIKVTIAILIDWLRMKKV
jgi:glycosyltransferase involved in cell wall biosynthesis